MKYNVVFCAVVLLMYSPAVCHARASVDAVEQTAGELEDVPLYEWDENDLWAQQAPTVTPAPPVTTPPATQPPAAAQPATTPPTPAAPVAPAPTTVPAPTPPAPTPEQEEPIDQMPPAEENMTEDDFSLGDIPIVETLELTPEKARIALDAYIMVREKYKDAALEDYENLQDFVDQSPQGKAFDTDIKSAGFANVTEWNTTITTLSFAYDNLRDDQTKVIEEQIAELQVDTEIAQDMKDRMIQALRSMIPSPNNKAILEALNADPAYKEKLTLLETEGE